MLKKTLENENFLRPALLCANIYQMFFSHLDTCKYLLLFFQESVQLVPSLYHILQQGCQNSNWFLYCWDGVSTRTQIFERKWNCQNMFTQIFLSEIISIAENGGQGTHFLVSQILKGLTHSAVVVHRPCIFLLIWEYAFEKYLLALANLKTLLRRFSKCSRWPTRTRTAKSTMKSSS